MTPLHESLEILPDANGLARRAAARVADWIAARPTPFRIALAGGNTPRELYRVLAEEPFRSGIAWERLEIFFGDERLVPGDHPESNFRMARETLLDRVPIPRRRIHPMVPHDEEGGSARNAETSRRYENDLERCFGTIHPGVPGFDLILLGMGHDGHTASLFPGAPALAERDRWVVSVPAPIHIAPHLPRITLTPVVLRAAHRILVLVSGSDKAEILAQALDGLHNPARLPIQVVRESSGEVVWLLDETVAGRLDHSRIGEDPS